MFREFLLAAIAGMLFVSLAKSDCPRRNCTNVHCPNVKGQCTAKGVDYFPHYEICACCGVCAPFLLPDANCDNVQKEVTTYDGVKVKVTQRCDPPTTCVNSVCTRP